jgi:hypothetical protein
MCGLKMQAITPLADLLAASRLLPNVGVFTAHNL